MAVGRNVLSTIRHFGASEVLYLDVFWTERFYQTTFRWASGLIEFQYERASMCPDQNSIKISTVAVEVLLQEGDLEKAIGLTGELFSFTDDVHRVTHIQLRFTLWLRHCARVWSACC